MHPGLPLAEAPLAAGRAPLSPPATMSTTASNTQMPPVPRGGALWAALFCGATVGALYVLSKLQPAPRSYSKHAEFFVASAASSREEQKEEAQCKVSKGGQRAAEPAAPSRDRVVDSSTAAEHNHDSDTMSEGSDTMSEHMDPTNNGNKYDDIVELRSALGAVSQNLEKSCFNVCEEDGCAVGLTLGMTLASLAMVASEDISHDETDGHEEDSSCDQEQAGVRAGLLLGLVVSSCMGAEAVCDDDDQRKNDLITVWPEGGMSSPRARGRRF